MFFRKKRKPMSTHRKQHYLIDVVINDFTGELEFVAFVVSDDQCPKCRHETASSPFVR